MGSPGRDRGGTWQCDCSPECCKDGRVRLRLRLLMLLLRLRLRLRLRLLLLLRMQLRLRLRMLLLLLLGGCNDRLTGRSTARSATQKQADA